MAGDRRLGLATRKRLTAALRAQRRGCEKPVCLIEQAGGTRAIDYDAPRYAPDSFVVDEIVPRAHGGDPLDPANVRPSHWRCNASHGGRLAAPTRRAIAAARRRVELVTSQEW